MSSIPGLKYDKYWDIPFNERLTKIRIEKGLSKADLARKIGCYKSLITMYENGTREPSDSNLFKLADTLNVNPNLLKYGVDTVLFDLKKGIQLNHYHLNQDPKKGMIFTSLLGPHIYKDKKECLEDINTSANYLAKEDNFEYLSMLAEIANHLVSSNKNIIDIEKSKKKKQK